MRGAPWTKEEEALLLKRFESNMEPATIAALHDRTLQAIVSRLVRMNELAVVGKGYCRVRPCWISFDTLNAET